MNRNINSEKCQYEQIILDLLTLIWVLTNQNKLHFLNKSMYKDYIKRCCEKDRMFDTDAIQGIKYVIDFFKSEYWQNLLLYSED